MHQSIPAVPIPPPPRATPGHFLMLPVPGVGHLRTSGWPPGIWHVVSKPWSESRIRDGGVYRPRRGLRCRLANPWRTREARGCSWMFLKVYFLNFRYFFIVKKQQLVLYSYITYREIENNQPWSGAFARLPHPHPGEFTKEMLMPGGQPWGEWALLELTDA